MYRFTDHFLVPVGVSMYADSAVFCPIDTRTPPLHPHTVPLASTSLSFLFTRARVSFLVISLEVESISTTCFQLGCCCFGRSRLLLV